MPIVLRLLVVAMAAQIGLDVVGLALGWAAAGWGARLVEVGALVLDVAILGAIVVGSEWVRRLLRVGAAAGLAVDTVLVTLLVGHGADMPALLTGLALLAGSGFTFWALGHPTVEAWVFERWVARRGV